MTEAGRARHFCFVAIDDPLGVGGGVASYVRVLGAELAARGHRVTVIAKGKKGEQDALGMRVVYRPLGNLHWYGRRLGLPPSLVLPLREVEWGRGVRRALEAVHARDPIDVIEGGEAGYRGGVLPGVPFVMRLHGERYLFAKHSGLPIHRGLHRIQAMKQQALARADALTAPSAFQAEACAAETPAVAHKLTVIPNPIDPAFLHHAPFDAARDAATVLFAGRLERAKGLLPLLGAVPLLGAAVPGLRCLVAGGRHASIDDRMLDAALGDAHTGARAHTTLLGHLGRDDLAGWYRRATVLAMPSYVETFGISAIEAMAFGVPVVASRAGGLPEVIEDGVTGLLVPPGDAAALAEALLRVLRDPALGRRLGAAGREKVHATYTPGQVAEATLAVYQRVRASCG